ncbi:TadE/TadG family type IV pilus assembly protein [Thaumasiovibrio subtropicus]|uniref:TadE/TadG family type IV pilus assembly protein n=1 Tax=Thaumasiovibrio subtropicus TaxID=1891207 RepID=UPI000B35C4F4|nr:TadE family protein [Thaumasiovibrio subtropicus]
MAKSSRGVKRSRGVVSIEFALGIFGFLLMFLFWVEVSYMGYVSSVVDLAITEASRDAKNAEEEDYKAKFTAVVQADNSLWGNFINIDNLSMTTRYYNSVSDLAVPCEQGEGGDCNEVGEAKNSSLAIYTLEYTYNPVFNLLFDLSSDIGLAREVIVIQEYERSEFKQ